MTHVVEVITYGIRLLSLKVINLLFAPFVHSSFLAHSFSIAAARMWSERVPARALFIVLPKLTISSCPSNPLNAFLAPKLWLLLTIVCVGS